MTPEELERAKADRKRRIEERREQTRRTVEARGARAREQIAARAQGWPRRAPAQRALEEAIRTDDRRIELHKGWYDRHPWLYYRTVHLLVERGLEDLAGLKRCGFDSFKWQPNVGEKTLQQLRWLIERGEEPMPPGFRFPRPERFQSVWHIVINEPYSKKTAAHALRRLADLVEKRRRLRNGLSAIELHDADGQLVGVASLTRRSV